MGHLSLKDVTKRNFKDASFILKLSAMFLNVVVILLWQIPEKGENGFMSPEEETLFAHTSPAYVIIMGTTVVVYFVDERPGKWFHRIFIFPGTILFLVASIIGLYNYIHYGTLTIVSLLISLINFCTFLILCTDLMVHGRIIHEISGRG